LSKTAKIGIIAGVIIVFVVLLYYFGRGSAEETYVTDDWTETYDPSDKGPYGTYVMKELLDTVGLFGNFLELNEDLKETLEDNPEVNDIYFFIGAENYLDDSSCMYLLDFVNAGNTVFMSSRYFPYDLLDEILYDPDDVFEEAVWDSAQYFKFLHPQIANGRYEYNYVYNNKVEEKFWYYFNPEAFDLGWGDTVVALGTNTKDQWNYIRIEYGGGLIYLHSTPYLFTNISLMRREGFRYAEKVLEHIPPGRVQWDRYNLTSHYEYNDGDNEGGGGEERRSMLEFILKNPPLLWGSILLIIGAILYALFKGKRMQKIVPAAELKENTSLRYINTLASLYMQERKHNKLIRLKEKTFLNFIADHYYISCKEPDAKFIEKVAIKSQVSKEEITDIFDRFRKLERMGQVTDEQLIVLHKKIENFYKKCR
jgi:hypothetical protein